MIDRILFLNINVLSGIALATLGALGILLLNRLVLPLYLMAWGAHVALVNTAAGSSDMSTAFMFYWLAQLFLPLQALLLLNHAADHAHNAQSLAAVHIQRIGKWGAIVVAGFILLAMAMSIIAPAQVLAIKQTDGFYIRQMQPLATWIIQMPHFLGTALGLVLLAWSGPQTRKDWLMIGGLNIAWASALGAPLAQTARLPSPDYALYVTLAIAGLAVLVIVPLRLLMALRREPARWPLALLVLAIPVVGVVAGGIALTTGALRMWAGPGAFRLAAVLLLLLPSMFLTGQQALSKQVRLYRIPAAVALASILLAITILTLSAVSPQLFGRPWKTTATGMAIASLLLIGSMGGLQMRDWLLHETTQHYKS